MVSLQIWSNRLLRECQDISNEGTLVVQGGTATLEDHRLDPQHGNCKLQMHFVLPSWSGKLEFDCGIKTRYPFDPPVVKIIEGAEGLPTHLKSNSVFLLPLGMGWTPSNTLRTCMLSIAAAVADSSSSNSPERAAPESNSSSRIARVYEVGETIRMDGVAGSVFPCRIRVPVSGLDETAAPSSYLVHRFLAVTPSQLVELDAAAEANHLHVLRVMPLRALSKVSGESATWSASVVRDSRVSLSNSILPLQNCSCVLQEGSRSPSSLMARMSPAHTS
jgi:ubiquitin-protein ligase